MSLNLVHQTSYPEYINHLSNETMIRQKYESMSQSDYSCENHHLNGNIQHHENVDKYLNFGDEMHHANHHILENYDIIHGVKQEDLDCDFLQGNDHKNLMEHGMSYDQNMIAFQQNPNLMGDASFYLYKQQNQINSTTSPTTGAGQSTPLSQVDNNYLSAKMKRIMKREKAKSRRKLNLEKEQLQQNQNSIIESQLKAIQPIISAEVPILNQQQPVQNIEDSNLFFKKSVELNGNQQQLEMRSCSTSCSSSNTAQFEVKIESSNYPLSGSPPNGKINPAHLLEQKLKTNSISSSLNHEELQLKALQQCSGNMDSKQQKKVMQMIRNRISAQNSRDRKKAYISKLETDKEDFLLEGVELREQLNDTVKELGNEKRKNEMLQKEIQELKKKLQGQCKCFNTSPNKIEQESLSSPPFYPKQHHNSLQKNYAAFSVAFFAVLGVVLIFNVKPSKNEQAIINQSSQMMKMLDDLQKSTQDYQKMDEMNGNDKDEVIMLNAPIISNKHYHKEELKDESSVTIHDEEFNPSAIEEEELEQNQPTPFNLNMLSKHSSSSVDKIQKDQWIQLIVPKQDSNNQRDDMSRDSAETDVTHNTTQKYMKVWAQIKSVDEFEHTN